MPDEPWLTSYIAYFMERRDEEVQIILHNSTRLAGREPQFRVIDDAEAILTNYGANPNLFDG